MPPGSGAAYHMILRLLRLNGSEHTVSSCTAGHCVFLALHLCPLLASVPVLIRAGSPYRAALLQAPRTATSPRTAAKRARLDQPLEPLRRTPAQAAASRMPVQGGDRPVRPIAAAQQPRQRVTPSQPAAPQVPPPAAAAASQEALR